MAHRDLTARFLERRANLRKRNLRFQMRSRLDNAPLLGTLFLSKQVLKWRSFDVKFTTMMLTWIVLFLLQRYKSHAMEKALLQDAGVLSAAHSDIQKPEWTRFADSADESIRLLHAKRTILTKCLALERDLLY